MEGRTGVSRWTFLLSHLQWYEGNGRTLVSRWTILSHWPVLQWKMDLGIEVGLPSLTTVVLRSVWYNSPPSEPYLSLQRQRHNEIGPMYRGGPSFSHTSSGTRVEGGPRCCNGPWSFSHTSSGTRRTKVHRWTSILSFQQRCSGGNGLGAAMDLHSLTPPVIRG